MLNFCRIIFFAGKFEEKFLNFERLSRLKSNKQMTKQWIYQTGRPLKSDKKNLRDYNIRCRTRRLLMIQKPSPCYLFIYLFSIH